MFSVQRAFILCCVFIIVLTGLVSAQDQETKIKTKNLPPAVLAAFQHDYTKAKITGSARETKSDTVYYEIQCKQSGVKRDLLYTPDGGLVAVEEQVRPRDLPPVVHASLMKEHPQGRITSAEKITQSGVTNYEVIAKDHAKLLEITVAINGTIVKTEEKTDNEKD